MLKEVCNFTDFEQMSQASKKPDSWTRVEGDPFDTVSSTMEQVSTTVDLDTLGNINLNWVHRLTRFIEWQLVDAAQVTLPFMDSITDILVNLKDSSLQNHWNHPCVRVCPELSPKRLKRVSLKFFWCGQRLAPSWNR